MSRDEAIEQLRAEFGEVCLRALATGEMLAVVGPQHIPGGEQYTRVALRLPEVISSVPKVYVETSISRNDGTHPNNAANVDIEGEPWREWSFNTEWEPSNCSMRQLVYAALSRFS